MKGDSAEPTLFEAALPLLRGLFDRERGTADATEVESVARELVRQVLRWARRRGEVSLSEAELAAVVELLNQAVTGLAGWQPDALQRWKAGHVALADRLLPVVASAGLSPRQRQETQTLLVAACRLVLDFVGGVDSLAAEFERRYRGYITTEYGRLRVYGVLTRDIPDVSLSQGYVPLTVSPAVPGAISDTRPLDQVAAAHPRLLLRGEAGAGKTTALQWLALSTDLVPFFLPVRVLARGEHLPGPDEFLSAVGCPLPAPRHWVHEVLAAGRGLVLVDGVDEARAEERGGVRGWLADLCLAYPGNRLVVTCRPSAVREGWLADLGFQEEAIVPLASADVETFVRHWHSSIAVPPPASQHAERAAALVRLLHERADLARLASNPLMCAVLCALHDERRGQLPESRVDLYSALLAMLLGRRDVERGISPPHGDRPSQAQQRVLLGALAYWTVRNGQTEMSYDQARHVIDNVGQRVPGGPDADLTLMYLLERSGVLRSPTEGRVDFVHRTFQDFLAARSLVEDGDFGLLVRHADRDQWRDVLLCAVGLARPRERTSLLSQLVGRGDASRERAAALRFYLLAAEALAEGTEFDPDVVNAVRGRIADSLPPQSPDEAAAFARLGRAVLPLLPEPDRIPRSQTAVYLGLIARVPGPEAEAVARRLTLSLRRSVRRELPEPAPGARQLAVALSIATRIEPELIRAVRLNMFPLLDAGDEADLWFSPWTAARTPQAMALRTELLPVLRAELSERLAASAPDDPLWKLGSLVAEVHAHISPALGVEERLNWLDVTGALAAQRDSSTADALLQPALRALVEEGREGIADWLAGAWPRLPEAVRKSTGAWQLLTAALHSVPDVALEPRPAPPGVTADDVAVIVDAVGDALLTVSRSGGSLTLGARPATARDMAILVPDTHPRVVEVWDRAESAFRTVTVAPGEERSVWVGGGPLRLRTPRGDVYELGAESRGSGVPGGSEGPGASDRDAQEDAAARWGPYFLRTTARRLSAVVLDVASNVWRAERLKRPETAADSSRLDELRGDYAELVNALLDADLDEVEVLLGELGGPADEPMDVTLAGRHPVTGQPSYVCVELRSWPVLHPDSGDPRLVRFGPNTLGVNPLERAHTRQIHLSETIASLVRSPWRVDAVAFLHEATGTIDTDRLYLADEREAFLDWLCDRLTSGPGTGPADALLSDERLPLPGVLAVVERSQESLPFHPLGAQTLVVARAMAAIGRQEKRVLVVKGAAGTGKTAVALRLFLEARELGATAVYTSARTPFRERLGQALTEMRRWETDSRDALPRDTDLGVTSGPAQRHAFDLMVFDGGRIGRSTSNGWSGPWDPDRRIDDLLGAADVSVFLLDEGSTLLPEGIASTDVILEAAEERGLPVDVMTLDNPVRFGGSTAYARWVSALLAPDEDAVPWIPDHRHVVLTADRPEDMEAFLSARVQDGSTAHITAGVCWPTSTEAGNSDVRVGGWHRPWQSWTRTARLDRVGTPQIVQGHEFDWCGVILGPDLVCRDGRWTTVRSANVDPRLRATTVPDAIADPVIRNAYRVLLTRGRAGVVLFSTDAETQGALRRLVPGRVSDHP